MQGFRQRRGAERTRTAVADLTHDLYESDRRDFGNRLAALADGEGCFSVYKANTKKPGFVCRFTIKLRADDRGLLERLRDGTGLGALYDATTKPTPGRQNNPAIQWHVETKPDCARLADIFEEFPLWSRKREQAEIWIAAVRYWNAPTASLQWDGRSNRQQIDWAPLRELSTMLRDLRRFTEPVLA